MTDGTPARPASTADAHRIAPVTFRPHTAGDRARLAAYARDTGRSANEIMADLLAGKRKSVERAAPRGAPGQTRRDLAGDLARQLAGHPRGA
jgi:hypothetical protein